MHQTTDQAADPVVWICFAAQYDDMEIESLFWYSGGLFLYEI
jgi:hypothetical protein